MGFSTIAVNWSVNHTSLHENSELDVFKYIKFVGEISDN